MSDTPTESAPAPPRSLPGLRKYLFTLIRQRLWLQVLIGMALGVGFGVLIGPTSGLLAADLATLVGNWVALPGRLFLLAIQFVVVPLVVASVIRGIAAGEAGSDLGRLGARTVAFFMISTLLAVALGVGAATLIRPGSFVDTAAVDRALGEGAGVVTATPFPT